MSSSSPNASLDTMLAQRRFLRPIVRALLRGQDGEDDVMQEALVRAWRTPEQPELPASWLACVVRNLSLDRLRAARRDARLRQRLAAADAAPSPDEVLQQEEQRRRIVHAVLALPQPYRSVVLLRYWEDMTPAAIAARLAVPGATVRSQLLRGLAMVRERLDAAFGDRRTWIGALAPCAGFGEGTAHLGWGLLLMTKTKFAAVGALLLLCGLGLWWALTDPTPRTDAVARLAPAAPPGPASADVASPASAAEVPSPLPAANERIAMQPAELAVRGQVLVRGAPYAGLSLTLQLQWFAGFATEGAPEATFAVACDEQGRFEWRGPARTTPGMVLAVAPRAPVKVLCAAELVLPDQREATLKLSVIPLDRVVFGRVHARDGTPIAGARLDVNLWPESEVATDAEGRYEMHVPAPGYPLIVRAAGFLSRNVQGYLPAGAMRHEFDIELSPGAKLEGCVVDDKEQPVEGAKILASGWQPGSPTDAEGRFVVDGVAAGERIAVMVSKPGFQQTRASAVPGGDPVTIVLPPGLAINLRVVDAAAAPVPGAAVDLMLGLMVGATRLGITDAEGRLACIGLPSRPVEIVVRRSGHVTARVPVDAREGKGELVVTLLRGQTIRGQVVDAAGRPVVGASIYCEKQGAPITERSVGSRADSDADGRFEITGLPAELCTLFAHHKDHQRGEFAFVGGAVAETTMRLVRALALAGRVVDSASGVPVASFTVEVQGGERSQFRPLDPVPFEAVDGRWRLADWRLPAGVPLPVVITAAGYAPAKLVLEAVAEPVADQNVVRLFGGTRVEGVVRDSATGQPLAGVTVDLAKEDARLRPNQGPATDASGRFAIDAVPAGEHRLRLQHADRPEAVFGPFVVGAGPGTLEVQPTLGTGVALRGRVTGAADAVGLTVSVTRADGRAVDAKVGADLAFEVKGLGAGRTFVNIVDRTRRTRGWRIEIGDRDVDGLEFPLRSGAGAIRIGVGGVTVGYTHVRRLDPRSGEIATVDSVPFQGSTLLVDGLAPGRYRVTAVDADGQREGSTEVDVAAGEVSVRVECLPRK